MMPYSAIENIIDLVRDTGKANPEKYYLLINGEKVKTKVRDIFVPVEKRIIDNIETVTGVQYGQEVENEEATPYAQYYIATEEENLRAANAARIAAQQYRNVPIEKRLAVLTSWKENIKKNEEKLRKIAQDEGLSLEAYNWQLNIVYDVVLNEKNFELYRKLTTEKTPSLNNPGGYLLKQPLGVIGIVIPFNAAIALGILAISSQIVSGNAALIKAPSTCPISTVFLCELLQEALNSQNIIPGVINCIVGLGEMIIEQWINERMIDGLVFFGGSGIGVKIGRSCLKAGIKPILELAGSDACVIDKNVDNLESIADLVVKARFLGSGQICLAIKRLIIHQDIHDRFIQLLVERVSKLKIGLPSDPKTNIIPLGHVDTVRYIMFAITEAVNNGAKVEFGGHRVDWQGKRVHTGVFFQPTIVTGVTPDMSLMQNEILGPVLPVIAFSTPAEAIAIANNSKYGLRSSIWSNDENFVEQYIRNVEAASIIVNNFHLWFDGDVSHLGGFKASSGTNNGAKYFINEMMAYKYVYNHH